MFLMLALYICCHYNCFCLILYSMHFSSEEKMYSLGNTFLNKLIKYENLYILSATTNKVSHPKCLEKK